MSVDFLGVTGASPQSARSFIESLELTGSGLEGVAAGLSTPAPLPPLRSPLGAIFGLGRTAPSALEGAQETSSIAKPATGSDPIGLKVQSGQDQTFMVGSQLISFNRDVTDERRAAALNSCLLAQLRASKLHPSPTTPEAAQQWHATYINTLTNIGWVLKSGTRASQTTGTEGASVDQVILEVVGALLGGGTALALATKVIEAIAKAKKDDPFITLYESRVVEQAVVEFGAGLASGESLGFLLSVVECAIEVRSTQHQLLFFKWNADFAKADGRRFDLSLADSVYGAVKSQIEAKILPFVSAYVAAIEI